MWFKTRILGALLALVSGCSAEGVRDALYDATYQGRVKLPDYGTPLNIGD